METGGRTYWNKMINKIITSRNKKFKRKEELTT